MIAMTIGQITDYLETIAPLSLQEGYDNSGLIVGTKATVVTQALITLDCTEAILDEAIATGCNLIIAHHPIVFGGLKRFNGNTYVERVVIKAIQNQIAIYAIHTNYDNVANGVNAMIAERLGLVNCRILRPNRGGLKKLCTFVPQVHCDAIKQAIFTAGAGHIGHYSETAFSHSGIGQYRGDSTTHPTIGSAGILEQVPEVKIETIFPAHLESPIIKALTTTHPYEEPAYDIIPIENINPTVGAGMIGTLSTPVAEVNFLKSLKTSLNTACVRHTPLLGKPISIVAICGGSGQFLLPDALSAGADVFITGDFKYHSFFDAEGSIVIADVGHYESEQFTPLLLHRQLMEKFPTFVALLSKINTNPVNYI